MQTLVLACQDTPPAPITTVDSVGVEIVRIPDFQTLDLPVIELRLLHSTASIPDLVFSHVIGAVFLADSSLAIADDRSYEIVFLDPDGSLRARSGGEGRGPGEYTSIGRIGIGVDGVPFVFDSRQRRFTLLEPGGEMTGVQEMERGLGTVPLSRLQNGYFLAAQAVRSPLPPGPQRAPVLLLHIDDSGQIVDTLGEWAGKERFVAERWNPVGFGATTLFTGRGPHALIGTTDSLDLTLYRGSVPAVRISGGGAPRAVTAEEKRIWTAAFLSMFEGEARSSWRRRLEQSFVRDTYPAYGAISVDDEGRIWIGDYPKLTDEMRGWTILEPDGTPVGTLSLPVYRPAWLEDTETVTDQPHELLDAAHGRIAVLRRDALFVEFVEVYQLVH